MCFIKSSSPAVPEVQETVQRHEANAEVTKTSQSENLRGYEQNVKTSPIGLTDDASVNKKTLLGE